MGMPRACALPSETPRHSAPRQLKRAWLHDPRRFNSAAPPLLAGGDEANQNKMKQKQGARHPKEKKNTSRAAGAGSLRSADELAVTQCVHKPSVVLSEPI